MQSIQVREGLHHGFVIRSEGVLTEGLNEVAHNSHVTVGLRRRRRRHDTASLHRTTLKHPENDIAFASYQYLCSCDKVHRGCVPSIARIGLLPQRKLVSRGCPSNQPGADGEEEAIRLSVKNYMTPLMLTTHTPLYNYFTTCRHCCPLTVLPSACRPPAGSGCPATGLLCEQGSGAGGGSHWQGTARWQGGRMPSFAGSTASGETCREAPPQLV